MIPQSVLDQCEFKPGDVVRLKDGDGRKHTIKDFSWQSSRYTYFAIVIFEDNASTGFIDYNCETGNWNESIIKII